MKIRSASVLALSLAALVFAGCSDSDNMLDGGQQPTSDDVTAAMQGVVLPFVDGMAEFSPGRMESLTSSNAAATSGAPEDGDCVDLEEFCFNEGDGSAEFCSNAPSGPLSMLYSACERPPGVIDGSWSFALDGFSATATLELSIDDLVLSGSVGYSLEGLCWEKNYGQLSAVAPDQSAMIDGYVRYCLAGGREGSISVEVITPDSQFSLELDFDGNSGSITVVWEGTKLNCEVDMDSGTADCEDS